MPHLTRVLATVALIAAFAVPVPAAAQEPDEAEGFSSDNMTHVANLAYDTPYPDVRTEPFGTDIEFAEFEVTLGAQVVERAAGVDRIATAAAVSRATFDSADVVLVARADDYADALAGAPLAAELGAPLLLSAHDALSAPTATEIARLGAGEAILLGGTAALSEQVETDLTDAGLTTRRVAGTNRFATAGLVMDELPDAGEVLVAEGEHTDATRGWPDALSAAGFGAGQGIPVLLVNADRLPDDTAERVAGRTVQIVGGTASVSAAVEAAIADGAAEVTRIAGANRYETSALVAAEALARGASVATTWLATGRDFADGLVAGAAVGATGGVLLLVDGQGLDASPATVGVVRDNVDDIERLILTGGTAAVSTAAQDELEALFGSGTELREFAIAGTYHNGMQIIDITNPEEPEIAAVYDCAILQGDVQVFSQGDRTYATYTSEDTSSVLVESECIRELAPDATAEDKSPAWGTYVVDITDPYNPEGVALISVPEGSHNGSVHPSGNYFYNSNSSLIINPITSGGQETTYIEYYDISDLGNIERLGVLQLPVRPGLGTESHDITFNADGTRAYSAALSQTVIIDTEDPANPSVISSFVDPAINVEHQSDPITVTDADGNTRDLLIVQDELAGAVASGFCPGGGLHIYDITGDNELSPQSHKVGTFYIDDFRPAGTGSGQGESVTCTSHVYRLYPEHGLMTIAWYNAGTRVIDISGLADQATDPTSTPMTEVGYFYFENSDTWSAKTNKIADDGSFYVFANDILRGLDVFKFTPTAEGSEFTGQWLSPAEAVAYAEASPQFQAAAESDYATFCLLQSDT